MNYSEIITRLSLLENKVGVLFATQIPGVSEAAIRLTGITTTQRTALGVTLAAQSVTHHIMVYDTEKQSIYIWNGSEWV